MIRTREHDVAPPPSLPPLGLPGTDEGPMRRELLRQIALLEQELTTEIVRGRLWGTHRANRRRGPAWQDTEALETIRNELVDAIGAIHRQEG
ncbi:MAG: hypothetical protein JWN65_4129 [Solirubrobacterales bacterium]|jgi:hypothetical protein|nr:hypothetical protein [Solirubrobacterales bacterium]